MRPRLTLLPLLYVLLVIILIAWGVAEIAGH